MVSFSWSCEDKSQNSCETQWEHAKCTILKDGKYHISAGSYKFTILIKI